MTDGLTALVASYRHNDNGVTPTNTWNTSRKRNERLNVAIIGSRLLTSNRARIILHRHLCVARQQ
jgi:hypothetical protein